MVMPAIGGFTQALTELYQPVMRQGYQDINRQYDRAATDLFGQFSGRGLYSSGAAQNELARTAGEQRALATGRFGADMGQAQAQSLQAIYQQAMQQLFQQEQMEKQRKWAQDDFLRNTAFDVAGMFVNPFATGLGANIVKGIAPDYFKSVMAGLTGSGYASGAGVPYNMGGYYSNPATGGYSPTASNYYNNPAAYGGVSQTAWKQLQQPQEIL